MNENLTRSDALENAAALAHKFLAKWPPGTDVSPSAFAEGGDLVVDETTDAMRRYVLRTLGVIDVTQGRGGPATTAANAKELYPRVIEIAKDIWRTLESEGQISITSIEKLSKARSLLEEDARRPTDLLKLLQLAVGIRRAGGLRLASAAQSEVIQQLASAPTPVAEQQLLQDNRGESAYYELIANLVDSWEPYEASIVGVQQVGRGEWSTPDIVAISVEPSKSLLIPIVRVLTVEVKLVLSRIALAEACAHRRFAHYSYVAVPQASGEMDPLLVADLASSGLGLICPRRKDSFTFHVYLEAQLNRPDEEDTEQLLQRFRTREGDEMSKVTRERVRKCLMSSLGL